MHELAICQAVLRQVLAVASPRKAQHISRITLRIGPLAGIEPALLRVAFPLVAAGTACEGAVFEIEATSVQVCCRICGSTSHVRPNRLLCARCGAWRVTVVSGDEMLLDSVEIREASLTNEKEHGNV